MLTLSIPFKNMRHQIFKKHQQNDMRNYISNAVIQKDLAVSSKISALSFLLNKKRILSLFIAISLFTSIHMNAQFSSPNIDANLDGSGIYPNSYTSGSTTWHMTWDEDNLYIFLQNANQSEPVSIYLDVDPIIPVNGGDDSNGTLVGLNYDGYTTRPNLPFRADVLIYAHNGYRELFRRDGANGWTSLGGGNSGIRGDGTSDYTSHANGHYSSHDNGNGNGGDDRREFRISWNRLLGPINGGNRPASFNWLGYVSYSNGMYAQVPVENYNGGAVSSNPNGITRYFTVSNTGNGTSTNPFGRNSYTHPITATNNSFGGISVWDFTMNSPGQQIARQNWGGDWNISGNLIVNSGTLYFGSGGSGYGTTQVSGNLNLLGGTLHMDQTNKSLDILGNVSISNGASLILSGTFGGDIKTQGNWTRVSSGSFNPNGRAVFFNGTSTQIVTVTGAGTETFNYLNIGGSGTLQLATGTNVEVNSNNGLTLASTNPTSTFDLNGQTFSLTGGGNLSLASGNRKITSSLSGGIFTITSNNIAVIDPGTLVFETATTLLLENGLNFGYGNPTTINGTLQLNMGAFVNINAPKYGASALLKYSSGSVYERRLEWTSNIGGAFGVPHHVTLTNNTTLNYPFGSTGSLGITGNLTVEPGSSLYMDYANVNAGGALTIMGNIVSAGNITLGASAGDDLKVGGNITFNSGYSFDAKNRAVFFTKNGTQTITAPVASPPTFHYVVFEVPSSGSATVILDTDLNISAPNTGNVISFGSTNDILDLNGKTLTLGTADTDNTIAGSGTFKGSTASNLTLLGNGSIGTVRFTSGAANQALRNLTVDRENSVIAMNLGTPITINHSLTLNKGLVDLGSNLMTLTNTATATSGPTSYVIVDESGTTGRLRKNINASNRSFTFPIGDNNASANGSQYSPATVNYIGGTLSSASMTLSVNDIKHPEMQASTDYITRYWRLSTTGITGSASFDFSGTYHPSDIEGTEGNSISGRWVGNQWTEGNTIGSNTLTITVNTDAITGFINEMSAGYPLGAPEINVVGNNTDIISGDTTPSFTDFTDFGNSLATRSSTFLIQNIPTAKRLLTISGVTITGTHASDFDITTFPASSVVAGGTTYLVIKFIPSGPGLRSATVTITNNDEDESSYTFAIQGQGIYYTECSYGTEEIIAIQDFEDVPETPTWGFTTPLPSGATITGGTAYGKTGDNGTTTTSDKFIGTKSLQVNNANAEILFDAIDTSDLSDVSFSMRVGAFSVGSNGNGMDATVDIVKVAISTNGGATWSDEITVNGINEAKWNFTSGTGTGVAVYDGNGIVENAFRPASGGYRTTDGYSTLQITNLPLVNALRIKIILVNNHINEIWAIDNIELKARRKSSKTWNGTVWSGDGQPPLVSEIAIIEGDYDSQTVGTGFGGCECMIASDATLTIASGDHLDIQSHFSNNGTVIFEDSSSLLQHNEMAVNTGTVSIKRNTQPVFRYDFTYWSSPLTLDSNFKLGSNPISLSPITLFDKYYKWNHNTTIPHWKSIPYGNEVMNPATGYIVRAPQNFDIEGQAGATAAIYTATFVGIPNNGIVEHAVTGSATDNKWNLLGNPYPSAINIEDFLSENSSLLDGTIYLWTHNTQIQEIGGTGVFQYNPSDYATYNFSGSTTTAAAASGGPTPDEFLASGQSFFVKGITSGDVVFNNKMRVAGNNNQFFRPVPTEPANNWELTGKHRVWLNLTGQNAFNQTLVGYIQNATNALDWGYDGDHFGGNKVSLYSIAENKNLAIQGRALPFNNQDQVPLGYKTTLTGPLKIGIDHYDGLFEGQDIYLEDLFLNIIHNLKESDYSFTTVPGTFNNRFVLRYLPGEELGTPSDNHISNGLIVYKNNSEILIKSQLENIKQVTVYDLLGRNVFEKTAIHHPELSIQNIEMNEQLLIVKVELANGQVLNKKIIH